MCCASAIYICAQESSIGFSWPCSQVYKIAVLLKVIQLKGQIKTRGMVRRPDPERQSKKKIQVLHTYLVVSKCNSGDLAK